MISVGVQTQPHKMACIKGVIDTEEPRREKKEKTKTSQGKRHKEYDLLQVDFSQTGGISERRKSFIHSFMQQTEFHIYHP